jgi:protein TonB
MSAQTNRIQGFVLLRFTVTETGSVADPEVLRSDPPAIFDRAAMRAVLRWKYQPQLANGEPVSVISYTRIVFRLADD